MTGENDLPAPRWRSLRRARDAIAGPCLAQGSWDTADTHPASVAGQALPSSPIERI
ncbi:MAG: hypothetical protein AVDCRST_MAG87-188 [uncultured Thermomicrobiales bacterium]|uniref:Uncharacterized protein n=1 Tax=uncultured Thermomicrobiales bacterium TaxID=1645740 RepID=A0A6J4U9B2_9BACT|nr:MAG: hypothetical protein AVDCRST_MAG87-188 [uncultured Thermomicrobiales bacterium]